MARESKIVLQTTANRAITQGFVNTPDGQIHYWTAGKGPVLLLIHQSSASAEEYADLVPYLFEDFRLVAYDWPGHGASDDPPEEPGIEEFSKSALAVLDHLEIKRCHVLGHHGGALVAMNLSWKYPRLVDKVILSGTSGPKTKEELRAFSNRLKKNHDCLDYDGTSLINAWRRYVQYQPEASPNQVLKTFINNIQTRLRPYDAHRKVLEWDRGPALNNLTCPVLLIQGGLDNYVIHQERLLKILPQAKRVVIESGGPFMFYDKADLCAIPILDFLSNDSGQ